MFCEGLWKFHVALFDMKVIISLQAIILGILINQQLSTTEIM